jgi:hypothetical protein
MKKPMKVRRIFSKKERLQRIMRALYKGMHVDIIGKERQAKINCVKTLR